jgi:predicted ArsR family transcriptional regulator
MDASHDHQVDQLARLGVLSEPVRRRLYDHVVSQARAVDRDEAASAVGIGRPLAAFHLDRLVAAGMLDVEFHRRSGRTGPGAGRPAKFYRRAAASQVDVSLPPRRYALAAEILADGLDRVHDPEASSAVLDSARLAGEGIAAQVTPSATGVDALLAVLVANGYEPATDEDGMIRLRNCPFHALVDRHRELTCSMNLALLESVAATLGTGVTARARPVDGFCCVAFVAEAAPAT